MPDESKTSPLDSEKLGRLLRLYDEDNGAVNEGNPGEEKRTLLEDLLADALPLDSDMIENLPTLLKRLYQEMPPILGKPLGHLLLSPDTNVEDLIVIKEHAKKMMSSADTDAKYETRAALYYAAIASALVYHDRKITIHTNRELEDSLSAFIERGWVTIELSQLLVKAREVCRSKYR